MDYNAYESSDKKSVQPINSSISTLFLGRFNLIFLNKFTSLIFYATSEISPQRLAQDMKKSRRPRTTENPEEGCKGPRLQQTIRSWQAAPADFGAQTKSPPRTAGPTAVG